MILTYFQIPSKYKHRVLFWDILGAILVYAGNKMFYHNNAKIEPDKNHLIRFFQKFIPVTPNLQEDIFFVRQDGKRFATPLFLVLILIETTDLIFAVDIIPAILAITQDQFIVYTSSVFGILGLCSLYFALAGVVHRFRLLSYGLEVLLVTVGIKMLLIDL